ncbi:ExbD/TolR family protein [Azovibrio restrictus]|uniref:ExbD/TolR family protein n=1 Tax=Azovibrio restrictus TaxID=146938 RepID=UPI0026F0037F|nr:ExbD/TolR family protein [Azovibrio restrictus]
MRRARRLKNEINVVPYIDVMLVLLVIFMVATPMMQTGSVDLPSVGQANSPPENPLRVTVGPGGELAVLDGSGKSRSVSRSELAPLLQAELARNPETAVLVAGDKKASYESVLVALDEIKALGFKRVGLETSRSK